ncbi:hypothetical protein [Streptomyces sp. WMMC905]|uniref:hypothetical protein n=1 Tax=Streptomyces sp. WMMC905 TaxID=3404123 RepID=UPI003B95B265
MTATHTSHDDLYTDALSAALPADLRENDGGTTRPVDGPVASTPVGIAFTIATVVGFAALGKAVG